MRRVQGTAGGRYSGNMKKKLFDEDDKWTPTALNLEAIALREGITAAFNWAEGNGYSPREAAHILFHAVVQEEVKRMM